MLFPCTYEAKQTFTLIVYTRMAGDRLTHESWIIRNTFIERNSNINDSFVNKEGSLST